MNAIPEQPELTPDDPQPELSPDSDGESHDHTQQLEKAVHEIATGHLEGTLVSIEAHTGEHFRPPEDKPASVTEELKKVRPAGNGTSATMYGPTRPGQSNVGSNQATMMGATAPSPGGTSGAAPAPATGPGVMPTGGTQGAGSGARPVAPFGGKIVVGTRIGQIEVTGVLGKGGMGEVFRGYHHALDINVAIKVLPDELSRNELVRPRFLREARLCVKLDHPNVVRVFNVDEHAGNLFLVMELIEGTDAAQMLKNGGRFRYRRALEIGAAAAEALSYAHSQGLVHRDVKPHNILLGAKDGKIKLSDFGLARAAAGSSHLTMSGQIMGTPHYMSPEQAEAKEVTDKSDVYSLGVAVYHMLTGETPFVGDTPISVAVQHIAKEILYPEMRFAPFPKELVAVLKRMTAKEVDKRCSAKQAAVWLRKLISMAPADDIQAAQGEASMNSLAPVVRESQAFEAAAKEREARDVQAREMARTMLATIQEGAALPRTMAESPAQQSAPQVQAAAPAKKGKGGLIAAAAAVVVLGGGGFAGWWFTMGPGSQQALPNNTLIAGGGGGGGSSANGGGSGSNGNGGSGGTTPGNMPVTNGTVGAGNGGAGNTAGSNGAGNFTTANNQPANNAPANNAAAGNNQPANNDVNAGTDTPPVPEDEFVNSELEKASNTIRNAESLTELTKAKQSLDKIRIELSRASQRQKEEFANLEARYQRQHALLSVGERFVSIRAGLTQYTDNKAADTGKAIAGLNTALDAEAAMARLNVPAEVEELTREERDTLRDEVAAAFAECRDALLKTAGEQMDAVNFGQADQTLALLATLKLGPEDLGKVQARRAEAGVRERHQQAQGELDLAHQDPKTEAVRFDKALKLLAEAEQAGVPETLKEQHAKVAKTVRDAVAARFAALLDQAAKAAGKGDYTAAREAYDTAGKLPLNGEQTVQLANDVYVVGLSESLQQADVAITGDDLLGARTRLDDVKVRMDDAGDRVIPVAVTQRYQDVRSRFDARLSQRFENLMATARACMKEKDFVGAGENLQEADKLPLTSVQRDDLAAFKKENEQALANYTTELITAVEKALDAGDFDAASEALRKANAMPTPEKDRERLIGLQKRFATEAVERHTALVNSAEKAIETKAYSDARKALDSAARIPVEETRLRRAAEMEQRYVTVLTEDMNARLKSADKLIDDGKWTEARDAITGAQGLPLTDTLRKTAQAKLDTWAEKLEVAFSDLLTDAEDARTERRYEDSAKYLAQAEKLPLSQAQLRRLSDEQDKARKDQSVYVEGLFSALQQHVQRGEETEGRAVGAKLQKLPLTSTEQAKLKRLLEELAGETAEARIAKLPQHLKKYATDRYCKVEQLIQVGEAIGTVYVTPDGKWGAAGTDTGKVLFFNLKRGTQLGTSSAGRRKVTGIGISPDGRYAACGNDEGAVVMFDLAGGNVQARTLDSVSDDVNGVAFSADSKTLFLLSRDGAVTRYNTETRTKLGSTPTGIERATSMAISPDGRHLAIGGEDGKVAVFDAGQMVLRKTIQTPGDDIVQRVAFSADSKQLVAGSIGDNIGVWDTDKLSEKPRKQLKGVGEWVRGVGFSSDGRRVAAFDNESRLIVWDSNSGTELKKLELEQLKGNFAMEPSAGCIAADGTVLMATRSGEILHLTVRGAQ
ncbi:MAG: protein kinase [Planctomycetes bacterium]|nr:protein kinase [Planctomycetota bacterium]